MAVARALPWQFAAVRPSRPSRDRTAVPSDPGLVQRMALRLFMVVGRTFCPVVIFSEADAVASGHGKTPCRSWLAHRSWRRAVRYGRLACRSCVRAQLGGLEERPTANSLPKHRHWPRFCSQIPSAPSAAIRGRRMNRCGFQPKPGSLTSPLGQQTFRFRRCKADPDDHALRCRFCNQAAFCSAL